MAAAELQARLDVAIDSVLDVLEQDGADELDPLATILARVQVRGTTLDLEGAPIFLQMMLGGMIP